LKRTFKIAIISGIVPIVLVSAALAIHFRLSEIEKPEIISGAEQNEKESASEVANEIINSIQNNPSSEANESGESAGSESNESGEQTTSGQQTVNNVPTPSSSEANESGESTGSESNESGEQTLPVNTTTEIIVKQVDGVYHWSNADTINPVITLVKNMRNPIHITNPTDTKHSFVIEQNGTVFLQTKDLEAGLSGNISINPTITGTFEYHCKYHPDTMKGTLLVIP